jgi:hypothetical protein
VSDTSRGGAYHNGKYRDLAHEVGLTVERSAGSGWSTTTVPDATAARYQRQIATLAAVIVAHRRSEHDPVVGGVNDEGTSDDDGEDSPEKAPRNGRALVCRCSPVRRVRAHKKTIDAGPILCGVCQQVFAVPAAGIGSEE